MNYQPHYCYNSPREAWYHGYNSWICENVTQKWYWNSLSLNNNISWQTVESNPDLPWDWTNLTLNNNLQWRDVVNNLEKP